MRIQRSGFPLMLLAALLLAAGVAAVLLLFRPFASAPAPDTPVALPAPAPQPAPAPAPAPPPTPAPEPTPPGIRDQEAIPAAVHTVRTGDTLFDIAEERWADPYLWPLILLANEDRLVDPDYLRPGHTIRIPQWVTVASGLTPDQRTEISRGHVLAYRLYRDLGSDAVGLGQGQPAWLLVRLGRIRLNKSMWVLYSGLRYDEQLLDRFAASIREHEVRQVRIFVDRFGLPPTRR